MVSVIFHAVNKRGAPVAGTSKYARESEVIVPSDTQYRIKDVKKRTITHNGEKVTRFDVDLEML